MTARVTNAQLMVEIAEIKMMVSEDHKAIWGDGNGVRGLVRKQDDDERNWKILLWGGGVIGTVLVILFSAFVNHSYASWEASTRIQSEIATLAEAVIETEPTPTVATVLPPTTTPTVPKRPTATATPIIPGYEREWLARLCVVEVRGMDEARDQACLSIISTVLTRAARQLISDGTIRGTLTWGCGPTTVACQFPAYTVNGCAGINTGACPLSYPDDLEHFRGVVDLYFAGIAPRCSGYLFYGIREFDRPECVITASNGQFLNFWERVAPHE